MSNAKITDPRRTLSDELLRRSQKNPRYSLRAFAKILGLSPAGLSLVLSGKRRLSRKTAVRVADVLAFDLDTRNSFIEACSPRTSESMASTPPSSQQDFHQISLDTFAVISDWYHYGILSLTETKDFRPDPRWIASRLHISHAEAKSAIERLERLGILDTEKWKQTTKPIKIENEVSTSASRKFQKQVLEKAMESLENDPISIRDMSSMTLALDPKVVPQAKEEIRKFRRALMKLLESQGEATEVFNLGIQLYPVSKRS